MAPAERHLWVLGAGEAAEPLLIVYEKPWQSGQVLTDWKRGNLTSIFKTGIKENPGRYRLSVSAWYLARPIIRASWKLCVVGWGSF